MVLKNNDVLLKIYFPNLNSIRFIAAFLVVVHHVEQFKQIFGKKSNLFDIPFVNSIGKLGVVLFFVLSGFLITYLLLQEEIQTKNISIKDFYVRRILRIWPLYFLIVFLGFFVYSHVQYLDLPIWSAAIFDGFRIKLIIFLLFMPNLALVLFSPVPYVSQTWSVGVEEQFYILWPILIKKFKNRYILLFFVIFAYILIKISCTFLLIHSQYGSAFLKHFVVFWDSFNIDCMAIGGVMALLLFHRSSLLKILFSKPIQIAVYTCLVVLIKFGIQFKYINWEIYAALFSILILNMAANERSIIGLNYSFFNYLGKISYGIYMFHPIAIVVVLHVVSGTIFDVLLAQHLLSLLLTVTVASISYVYFESPFLKMKVKFSKILSGDNAK